MRARNYAATFDEWNPGMDEMSKKFREMGGDVAAIASQSDTSRI